MAGITLYVFPNIVKEINSKAPASLSDVDIALIMTEPSQSGLHDLKRILGVVEHFDLKLLVCINKYEINEGITEEIEEFCK